MHLCTNKSTVVLLVRTAKLRKTDLFCQKKEVQVSARSLYSHLHAEPAPAGTTGCSSGTSRSIAGRRKMHDCTSDSTRGVHVSNAVLQKE